MSVRLLLADEADLVLIGAQTILKARPEFEVIHSARSGDDLLDVARRCQPEVILFNEYFAGEGYFAASHLRFLRMIGCVKFLNFPFRIVCNHNLQWSENGHGPGSCFVQIIPDTIFKN